MAPEMLFPEEEPAVSTLPGREWTWTGLSYGTSPSKRGHLVRLVCQGRRSGRHTARLSFFSELLPSAYHDYEEEGVRARLRQHVRLDEYLPTYLRRY